jgi:hypothetical protein
VTIIKQMMVKVGPATTFDFVAGAEATELFAPLFIIVRKDYKY